MAFNNTNGSDFIALSPTVAWIEGLQLIPNGTGTITFFGGGGELELPEGFVPNVDTDKPLRGVVRVSVVPNSTGPLTNLPVSVSKDEGDGTLEGFVITLTNTKVDLNTQLFEVYVELVQPPKAGDGGDVTINVNVTK